MGMYIVTEMKRNIKSIMNNKFQLAALIGVYVALLLIVLAINGLLTISDLISVFSFVMVVVIWLDNKNLSESEIIIVKDKIHTKIFRIENEYNGETKHLINLRFELLIYNTGEKMTVITLENFYTPDGRFHTHDLFIRKSINPKEHILVQIDTYFTEKLEEEIDSAYFAGFNLILAYNWSKSGSLQERLTTLPLICVVD